MSTPSFCAYCASSACSASMNAAMPPCFWACGDHLERQRRLARRLGAEDLDHAAARHAPHAERQVQAIEPVEMAGIGWMPSFCPAA